MLKTAGRLFEAYFELCQVVVKLNDEIFAYYST